MKQQWKLVPAKIFTPIRWGKVVRKTYRGDSGESDFIVLEKPEFALIAAIDESRNLLLVRQYRHGVDRSYWALPGGFIDSARPRPAAAQRELREETGYTAKRVSYVGALHPIPAFLKTMAHIVLCEEIQKDPAPSSTRKLNAAKSSRWKRSCRKF